ncbi:MAG: DNA mismatch repair endonuclease MutL [Lachnospiraceae bacterium]|nr:DNA mismatch repair endonuclease MutL [Lachnospiraceae bacterium]
MAEIALLSQETIDKIAAGEVIERPSSVVKELIENSIDAGATAITVEIKEGGISFIRITDNGCGIEKEQVPLAFLRHSTSKIKSVEDLLCVSSLGFRGEALSSIAAVAQVELITKTIPQLTGVRYVIEGSKEKELEEIGAPDGTTFIVRNLFFNTPARRKFLKSPQTEGGYISTLVERLALSHPDISFKLIVNNQTKLHTSGNSNAKDVIYQIYGRDITASLLEVNEKNALFEVKGFIGKPIVSRGNRNFENYFINQRYIKSSLIAKGIEDAYKNFLMQHQYPFCVLYFSFAGEMLDVNVHPTKMELRFSQNEGIYQTLYDCIRNRLVHREHIPDISLEEKKTIVKEERIKERPPEPFEKNRLQKIAQAVRKDSPYEPKFERPLQKIEQTFTQVQPITQPKLENAEPIMAHSKPTAKAAAASQAVAQSKPMEQKQPVMESQTDYVQEELVYEGSFLSEQSKKLHKIIGQVFDTYWLVEFDEKLFIIDQHAAHEKVLYEKTVAALKNKEFTTQLISPPIILSLDNQEEAALKAFDEQLKHLGFEIEHFGGKEYAVCGVPGNLFNLDAKQILLEILDSAEEIKKASTPDLVLEKIASMSCKAAVKGNHVLKLQEIETLIKELLELENPYFCPHGRPTIISMSKYELEKKFKRIV